MPELHWLGDGEAKREARRVPYRLLTPVEQVGDPAAQNLLIQGDNLEALKALLPFYAGRVKCIFIDPPYNTKSAFEHYDDNLEHSQWLSMMYPRLELLRDLLSEEGSIWVTIDDNEAHYLKVLMDEVFGRRNFLTTFIWQKSYGGGAKARYFVGMHEYVHCYAKEIDSLPDFFWPPDKGVAKYYKLKDEKFATRGPYRLQPLATTSNDERPNLRYAIPAPDGTEIWPKKQWQWSQERVAQAMLDSEIVFTKSKNSYSVSYKQYLLIGNGQERKAKPKSIISGHYTQQGTYESIELFGLKDKFAFPKPEGLIERVLEAGTRKGDLILDSFLGSGTSVAVAHKMGRRYIGIEMGEHAITHCLPRLKKVIEGEQGGVSEAVSWAGGGGFRFMKLGEPVFREDGCINPAVRFDTLASYLWFLETGTPHSTGAFTTPLLGVMGGETNEAGVAKPRTALILLYNGILGDRRPQAGNVLTTPIWNGILAQLPPHDGPRVIYGEACRLSRERLKALKVTFKQIPHEIRMR